MDHKLFLSIAAAPLLVLAGCAPGLVRPARIDVRPLGRDIPAVRAPRKPPRSAGTPPAAPEPEGAVTLRRALELALAGNPRLAAFSWKVRAGEARTLQAGLLPNPEADIEVEEFGGEGPRRGFDGAETSLWLRQLIELGGKRSSRIRVAELGREAAAWNYEAGRLDVVTETTKAYIDVLYAQKRVELSASLLRLAQEILETVAERVRAGKVSPLEESKARVVLAASRIESERARRNLVAARKKLAASWGGTDPVFTRAEGDLESLVEIPPLEELQRESALNPDLSRRRTEIELRRAAVELEEARGVPDPTLSVGARRFEETDGTAFLLGLSIPFPLFDRNQGGVLEARYDLAGAVERERAAWIEIRTAVERVFQELSSSRTEAIVLKKEILPAARAAFDASREGFLQGKFGYLDVLDAQRTLFEAQGRYIIALAAHRKAAAEMERLAGRPLGKWKKTGSQIRESIHGE